MLCAGVCLLWVRSYVVGDVVRIPYSFKQPYYDPGPKHDYRYVYYVASSLGRIQFSQNSAPYDRAAPPERVHWFRPADRARRRRALGRGLNEHPADWQVQFPEKQSWLGFGRAWQGGTLTGDWALVVPHWFACIAFAAVPLWRLRSWGRRRRRTGLCRRCGYDLRATPGRCPECGTLAAATVSR